MSRVVSETVADVVELPWALQRERSALALVRKSGRSLVLWAHPEDMQARAGREEPLFTPGAATQDPRRFRAERHRLP